MVERRDLAELEYLFGASLSEGLHARNIKRVGEVGIGSVGFSMDLGALRELVHLEHSGQSLFKPEDVLGVDPNLPDEDQRKIYAPESLWRQFRTAKMSALDLAEAVRLGEEPPFDLVLCKGVLSTGLFYLEHQSVRGIRRAARSLLDDLSKVINRQNPHSLMVISDVFPDTAIPVSDQDFEAYGLRIIRGRRAVGSGTSWVRLLQRENLVSKREKFYSITIAQPK